MPWAKRSIATSVSPTHSLNPTAEQPCQGQIRIEHERPVAQCLGIIEVADDIGKGDAGRT
jgi:hypothetical protein